MPLEADYTRLLQQYLCTPDEEEALYHLSRLGHRFLAAGFGPEDVAALHSESLEQLEDVACGSDWVGRSMSFLVEAMIAYGVRHREMIQTQLHESAERAARQAAAALAEAEERIRQNRQTLEDRDDFVAFIAHELRRPLTTIQGRAALARRQVEGQEKLEAAFADIHRAAQHMSATCDLLLQLSQQERDYTLTTPGTVNLATLLHTSLHEAQAEQGAPAIPITIEIELPDPLVPGDEAGLRAVFANLLANAVKYNRDGGSVHVLARQREHWVQVEVADTGIGIPPDEVAHIFNRYYRIKSATSDGTSGSGLGLALVEYIVHQHGGHISVRSQPGVGSCFIVQLPKAVEQARA